MNKIRINKDGEKIYIEKDFEEYLITNDDEDLKDSIDSSFFSEEDKDYIKEQLGIKKNENK